MPVWGFYLGGAVLLSLVGFGTGWQVRSWKADSDELEAVQLAIAHGREQQELADYKAGRYEGIRDDERTEALARDTEIRTIYRTERVEVPAICEPPATALVVLDASIRSANSQVAGQSGSEVPEDTGQTNTLR